MNNRLIITWNHDFRIIMNAVFSSAFILLALLGWNRTGCARPKISRDVVKQTRQTRQTRLPADFKIQISYIHGRHTSYSGHQRHGGTMASLFGLPDEIILTPLLQSFPGRDHQIRSLATLLHVRSPAMLQPPIKR